MFVSKAAFHNYRNLGGTVEFGPGLNLISGRNGQGKTNILEALHVAGTGASFRPGKLCDLIRFDAGAARVELAVVEDGVELPLLLSIVGSQRRHAVGGRDNCSLEEVGKALRVVFFGPEELDLVKGGPAIRRAFLDQAIQGHHPPYGTVLRAYQKLVRERNQLLREEAAGQGAAPGLLDSYEEELARHGAALYDYRRRFLRGFQPVAAELVGRHSDSRLSLTLIYRPSLEPLPAEPTESAALLRQRLAEQRPADGAAGRTGIGPHHDEIELLVNGRAARFFSSQGEQRQVAVSLKIAQLAIWRERFSVKPVLLLDDVFSELDPERRRLLLEVVREWQVQTMISTTSRSDVLQDGDCRSFVVEEGRVREE